MCGIVGVASVGPTISRDWVTAAAEELRHRGPDDGGVWWSSDGRVGLGHRRLSILDLSAAGHQPMQDPSGDLTITFNGEIYNYLELRAELSSKGVIFRSQSDTEVILAAYREWGNGCLAKLDGMFSFAIYSAPQQVLFLARDRVGEKPLYYFLDQRSIRFASELKALLVDDSLPRSVDPASLDCYLALGYVPGKRCILEGFSKLPPAHALQFDIRSARAQTWRYWDLPEVKEPGRHFPAEADALLDELESLLEASVRRQLAADVPVGVLLSGGLDSSLVTAMAVRASSQVRTFTIGFPGHGRLDERQHALRIADHFKTRHTELSAEPSTEDQIHELARQFDEPLIDSSMIPTAMVSKLVRSQCTVALGGDGGDELFGGYREYSRLLWLEDKFGSIPYAVRKTLASLASTVLPLGFKGRNWVEALGVDLESDVPLLASYFDGAGRRSLMSARPDWKTVAEEIARRRVPRNKDVLQRATRMDFSNYLAEDILVKVDRASMLHSLEVRAPMLDRKVVEFAFGRVPSSLKATPNDRKILLKRLAARVLPAGFDLKRKQGFSIPMAEWLKAGAFRQLFRNVLLDPGSSFDGRSVERLWRDQSRLERNGERLFALAMFELWRRNYRISV